jgi:hypothetical protein
MVAEGRAAYTQLAETVIDGSLRALRGIPGYMAE